MNNEKYEISCPNCREKIKISKREIEGEDIYYIDCCNCSYTIETEVEYDDEDNIVDLHVY